MNLSQPTDDVQSLRRQLASAHSKLQVYNDIIISQANELRILRDNICQNCKTRFAPSPESSAGTASSSNSKPGGSTDRKTFWRRMLLSHPFPTKRPDLSPTPSSIRPSHLASASSLTLKPFAIEHPPLQTSKPVPVPVPIPSETTTPEWMVKYEKTESRTVDVTFVRAFALEAKITSVRFSPDGRYLAASMENYSGKILVYGVESAKDIRVLREPSPRHTDHRLGLWYPCFSRDGRHLATTGSDYCIRLWSVPDKRVRSLYGLTANIHTLDISPDGRFLASASYGIIMWRIRDGSKKILSEDIESYSYSFLRFTPDGLYIVTVDSRNTLKIWNIRTGRLVARWTVHEENASVKDLRGRYHKSHRFWTVSSVGVSSTAEGDQKERVLLYTSLGNSNAVVVSPDGRWVLSGSNDGGPHIWDVREGLQQCSLVSGHAGGVASVDFSPMGKFLAVGQRDHISLWSYEPRAN